MCAAHRAKVVAEIRRRLLAGEACRVFSTQVIEAGVDVDFPAVYRAAAGLDSIAQAAGRCNREGLLKTEDGQLAAWPRVRLRLRHEKVPDGFLDRSGRRLFPRGRAGPSERPALTAAVKDYFRLHYWQQGGDDGKGWDRGVEQQSIMDCFAHDQKHLLHAQFRTAAEAYRLIDDAQARMLVPYGRARAGADLRAGGPSRFSRNPGSSRLRPRSAAIRRRRLRRGSRNGCFRMACCWNVTGDTTSRMTRRTTTRSGCDSTF